MSYSENLYWLRYQDPSIQLNENAGKLIAYVRCDPYTTQQQRFDFFKSIVTLLKQHYSLPVAGKISTIVNQNNLCPFLFYCNDKEQALLKKALIDLCPFIEQQYQSWFYKSPDVKILTWNWRWKSNQQTIDEINNQTHWSYRAGLRLKK